MKNLDKKIRDKRAWPVSVLLMKEHKRLNWHMVSTE